MKLFFHLLAKLPLRFLYVLGDFFYFLAYYIIGYRREVVWQNLRNSFPEKSEKELKTIQKQFYRGLIEVFVETLKVLAISPQELERRVQIRDLEKLTQRLAEGKTVLVYVAHLFNWEWLSLICNLKQTYPLYFVYQPLSNPFFDKLMLEIRTRFGAKPLKMQNVLKDVLQNHTESRIVAFLADQSPAGTEKDHWTTFLNQDTAFFAGVEKIATKLGLPVLFGGVRKLQRGYYELYFEEIYHPQQQPNSAITETYVRLLEKQIQETPPNWLWSHKRWKKKRNF
ncbi:MAG: lysophospholipid acyltransferase family protein [Raineya sp.]|nr:lysophospholipid acyltransferase family protein [Raineya sp.]MDW8295794.1 lysophospholipid acyltransferase family protein [Raineya sp.]